MRKEEIMKGSVMGHYEEVLSSIDCFGELPGSADVLRTCMSKAAECASKRAQLEAALEFGTVTREDYCRESKALYLEAQEALFKMDCIAKAVYCNRFYGGNYFDQSAVFGFCKRVLYEAVKKSYKGGQKAEVSKKEVSDNE